MKRSIAISALLLFFASCTGVKDDTGPLTLESLGIEVQYHNGERGVWAKNAEGKTLWVPERQMCLKTFRPVARSKTVLGRLGSYYKKPVPCTVTCACTAPDGASNCNPVWVESGSCGCAFEAPCTNCARS